MRAHKYRGKLQPMRTADRSGGAWVGLISWGIGSALLYLIAPHWPQGPISARLGFLLAFTMIATTVILGSIGAAQAMLTKRVVLASILPGILILWIALIADLAPAPMSLICGGALLLLGTWIGSSLGRTVQHASYLWPLVLVAIGADLWSVTSPQGVTNQVMESSESALTALILLGTVVPGVGPSPVLGVGDVLFTGFLSGAVIQLNLAHRRLILGLAVG